MIIQKVIKGLRLIVPPEDELKQLYVMQKALFQSRNKENQKIEIDDEESTLLGKALILLISNPFISLAVRETISKYILEGKTVTEISYDETKNDALQLYSQLLVKHGIICNWWEKVYGLPSSEILERLTDRNLDWHQNKYNVPDPLRGNKIFSEETPFISTTAGTVVRDNFQRTNLLQSAKYTALQFATNWWQDTGILAYCYVFTLGKKAVGHRQFAEELRELNIYTGFSPYQPEGEITAKIEIPSTQIERIEIWKQEDYQKGIANGYFDLHPDPKNVIKNPNYLNPEDYHNIRELLEE